MVMSPKLLSPKTKHSAALFAFCLPGVSCYAGLPEVGSPFANGDDDDNSIFDDDDDDSLYEGDDPGECSDGADNDQDGLFDCDDPGCAGSPDCNGDDDDSVDDDDDTDDDDDDDDDDDTTPDDDDTTPDDDDASPNDPVIISLSANWNAGLAQMEFSMNLSDPDCDLGSPTLHWMVDSELQIPMSSTGPNLGCDGYLNTSISGLTLTYAYVFAFSVEDSAGNTSAWESINVIAQ